MQDKGAKKKIAICLSTAPSAYQKMLHAETNAKIIYSKEYNQGTLYALIFDSPGKKHSTIDNAICSVDTTLKSINGGKTLFMSISDVRSCKVKTFRKGEHAADEHYSAIFTNRVHGGSKKQVVHPGVDTWTFETAIRKHELDQEVFDVVKKMRMMDQAPSDEDDQSSETLTGFQAFVDAVWPAIESVCLHDEQLLADDLRWVEEQKSVSVYEQVPRHGFVYAAWNQLFPDLIKIGATHRDTPFARLKELSGSNVPRPFELVACLPSKDPFAMEKNIHSYFNSARIKKGTRYCEFFRLSREMVSEYFSSKMLE